MTPGRAALPIPGHTLLIALRTSPIGSDYIGGPLVLRDSMAPVFRRQL